MQLHPYSTMQILVKRLFIFSQHGVGMRILLNMKHSWSAIRWKMLFIFAFFSVISMILVACFAVAVLNVVIRRESAYLIEERTPGLRSKGYRLMCIGVARSNV